MAAPAPPPLPAHFSPGNLAAAFAVAYGAGATETDDQGSELALKPRRLVPVAGQVVALISEGVRDGGGGVLGCHGCGGSLRIDYLVWDGAGFAVPALPVRFDEPGASWGAPPTWKVRGGAGAPTIAVQASFTNMGCVVSRAAVLKLTPGGVARSGGKRRQDCDTADVPPPPAPPAEDGGVRASRDRRRDRAAGRRACLEPHPALRGRSSP